MIEALQDFGLAILGVRHLLVTCTSSVIYQFTRDNFIFVLKAKCEQFVNHMWQLWLYFISDQM